MAAAIPAGREHWSSPQQQLEILLKPITEELASAGLPVSHLAAIVAEYADANIAALAARARWITPKEQLERLLKPITEEVASAGLSLPSVASIVSEYVGGNFSNWHTALKCLDMLPEVISPLPLDIHEILEQRCPIRGDETKEDGSYYSVSDTHSLYLIPTGTLNELVARARAYGKAHLAQFGGKNLLQLTFFNKDDRVYGDIRSVEPQWILISNELLEGSRSTSYAEKAKVVAELGAKALANYKVPLLKEAAAFALLDKVATGKSFLKAGASEEDPSLNYTCVRETVGNEHLLVGGYGAFNFPALDVGRTGRFDPCDEGVLAVRKFYADPFDSSDEGVLVLQTF